MALDKKCLSFLVELTHRVTNRMDMVIDEIQDRTDFFWKRIINNVDSKFRSEILAVRETILKDIYLLKRGTNKSFIMKKFHGQMSVKELS